LVDVPMPPPWPASNTAGALLFLVDDLSMLPTL
jgi:hypothetical protein